MRRQTAAAFFVVLGIAVSGCAESAPKDAAPVLVGPTVSATPSVQPTQAPTPADPTGEPTFAGPRPEPTPTDDEVPGQDGFLIPDDEVLFTADELYSSTVAELYADVAAADRSNRIGICRSAAIVVGGLTSSEIEERRGAMSPSDVETLDDFVSLCRRVLAS